MTRGAARCHTRATAQNPGIPNKTARTHGSSVTPSATAGRRLNPPRRAAPPGTRFEVSLLSERSTDPTQEASTDMSDLLAAALRMMAPKDDRSIVGLRPEALPLLPATLSYADSVRRFDPASDPLVAVSYASAVAHLLRVSRALETLNGFALARDARAGLYDSDHLYQAHGEPRD